MASERITISQIAKEAGVAKSTVSRVLNNRPGVLPDTRERIMAVVEKYQFQPSVHARRVARQGCHTIGVVFTLDIDYVYRNPFYTETQSEIMKTAKEHGYDVLMLCCENLKEAVAAFMEKRVDGLMIITPQLGQREAIKDMLERDIPMVCLGMVPGGSECVQVCTSNYEGAVMAMQHLIDLGHRRIGYINGPSDLFSSNERYRAYQDCMKQYGFPVSAGLVQEGINSIESGYVTARAVFSANPDVTAFFVVADLMAIGVINAVKDLGFSVPEDISVVGFDNIPIGKQFTPALTTIDQHIRKKARTGVELLLDLMEDRPVPEKRTVEVAPTLVVRRSSGPCRREERCK